MSRKSGKTKELLEKAKKMRRQSELTNTANGEMMKRLPTIKRTGSIVGRRISGARSSGRRASLRSVKRQKHTLIVLEIGENATKCGFAGESEPRWIFENIFYHPTKNYKIEGFSSQTVMEGKSEPPLKKEEWDVVLNKFIRKLYFDMLQTNPKDRKVILVENPFIPLNFKKSLLSLLFKIEVPGVLILPSLHLPLFAYGEENGIIIDIGHSETRCLPILAGYGVFEALRTVPFGMKQIVENFVELVNKVNEVVDVKADSRDNICLDLAAKYCIVKPIPSEKIITPEAENKEDISHLKKVKPSYESPTPPDIVAPYRSDVDIKIPGNVREDATEIFFNDSKISDYSLPQMVCESLLACSIDSRPFVISNLMFSGGTCNIHGLIPRLIDEINNELNSLAYREISHLQNKIKFKKPMFPFSILSWVGGSILGQMTFPAQIFYTKEGFLEGLPVPDSIYKSDYVSWMSGTFAEEEEETF